MITRTVLTWVAKGIVVAVWIGVVGVMIFMLGDLIYAMFKDDLWLSIKLWGAFVVIVWAVVYLVHVEDL